MGPQLFSNSIARMHQLLSEERNNGKDGLKTLSIMRISKLPPPIPESHMPPLSSNSRTHQLRSEVKNNGKDGLKTSSIMRISKLPPPTLESHTHQPFFKLKEVQKDSPTVWLNKKKNFMKILTWSNPSPRSQTTSISFTSPTQTMKTKSLSKLRIETASHSTSDSESP